MVKFTTHWSDISEPSGMKHQRNPLKNRSIFNEKIGVMSTFPQSAIFIPTKILIIPIYITWTTTVD